MKSLLFLSLGVTLAASLGGACGGGASGSGGGSGGSATGGGAGTGGATGPGAQTGGAAVTGGAPGTTGGLPGSGGGGGQGPATGGKTPGGAPGGGGSPAGGSLAAHLYAAPDGSGTACSAAAPCAITQAQMAARTAAVGLAQDLVVELADGVYRLKAPLVFDATDAESNGHTITWQAATGAHPVLSGAQKITGWTMSDAAKGIWKATAPGTFATRQLFVDGKVATRARQSVNRADLTFTDAGFRFSTSSLAVLNTLAHPERTDLHAVGSFTDRYSPVQSIAGGTATMVQPAWNNNNWGYDTIKSSFRASSVWMENALEFLDQAGEWYLDTTGGTLYYKPLANQDMAQADVELPQIEALVVIGGTYDKPAHDLVFKGLTFSHTSWLGPNSSDGYSSQQTGAYIHGSDYPEFEATRPKWWQMPAAVQVSAAKNIAFVRDRFVALGEVGLGIGNDANAHVSKVGLGADTITVQGCVFAQIASGSIVIGGIQADAHHPSDPRMVNQNMTVSNNLVHDVGIDYRDAAGIFFTYTKKVAITHNEVYNIPYSGINSGYGWGANDQGGSDDYAKRGLYKYQMRYTTPTVAQDNTIQANYVHDGMQQMNDGGCHYNLGANPGTVVTENYCKGPWPASSFGDYEDEGSRYLTLSKNVFTGWGSWITVNASADRPTGDLTVTGNWVSGNAMPGIGGTNNKVSGNIAVTGNTLPADGDAIAKAAGLEAAYADLKTNP